MHKVRKLSKFLNQFQKVLNKFNSYVYVRESKSERKTKRVSVAEKNKKLITRKKLKKIEEESEEAVDWLTTKAKELKKEVECYQKRTNYIKQNGSKKHLLLKWNE
jgi:bacterioferritin (cytochrome b1)